MSLFFDFSNIFENRVAADNISVPDAHRRSGVGVGLGTSGSGLEIRDGTKFVRRCRRFAPLNSLGFICGQSVTSPEQFSACRRKSWSKRRAMAEV